MISSVSALSSAASSKPSKQAVLKCIESVARRLGNTKAICRKCYIHPMVVSAFLEGRLPAQPSVGSAVLARKRTGLSDEEAKVLSFLRQPVPSCLKGVRNGAA